MFPDKELAYDILYKPRLQRLMNERFRLPVNHQETEENLNCLLCAPCVLCWLMF